MSTAPTLLALRSIGKRFPGVVALDNVDLDVRAEPAKDFHHAGPRRVEQDSLDEDVRSGRDQRRNEVEGRRGYVRRDRPR